MQKNTDFAKLSKEEMLVVLEKLMRENEQLKKGRKYGLVWEEEKTREQFEYDIKENYPVLKEVEEREIKTDKSKPTNILIEGENYHALTILQATHKGKIDVIYIDPPYNTGNKDFKYNDKFVDKEDGYRHSKWLSFMEKRLMLAKDLLRKEGVIYISIDDNEYAQLKLLCDKIFGENNFISNIVVKTSSTNGFKIYGNKPVRTKDYILIYSKNINYYSYNRLYVAKKGKWDTHYNLFYDYNENKIYPLKDILVKNNILSEKQSLKDLDLDNKKFKEFYKKYSSNICQTGNYKDCEAKKISKKRKDEIIIINTDKDKIYLYNGRMLSFLTSSLNYIEEEGITDISLALSDIWTDIDYNNIQNESPVVLPNGQKPLKLIKRLIRMYPNNKNAIILDFFAGSGTTGHAVLELNKEDGGNRQFILVTNNENNICEEICYERLRRVIQGYTDSKGRTVEGLGGNLKYFRTDYIPKTHNQDQDKVNLANRCCELLCLKENTFNLIKETDSYKIFCGNNMVMAVYFSFINESKIRKLLKDMTETEAEEKILYCFTLGNDVNAEEVADFKENGIHVLPIPKEIQEIYEGVIRCS